MAPFNRPAVRSWANVAGMPAASPNGSVAWSIADNGFAVKAGGVWGLVALPVIPPGTITQAMLVAGSLDATVAKNLADGDAIAGLALKFTVNIADGPSAPTDFVTTFKVRILDVHVIKKVGAGGMGDTIQVQTGMGAPISDAMSINVMDQTIVRAGAIDDTTNDIAALGTIRVNMFKMAAANTACQVVIHCVRVA
ncbi:MAG: hypothetical protein WC969_15380 [Elusimicrobiota bacterium]|jgi:hypothetical protein